MTTLGPYEIRGELGRGAMAVVWRAWDASLEREVAIKEPLFAPTLDEGVRDELAARFLREGRTVAAFNHPGIVTVYAADVYDGRLALVMELIEDSTLAEALERGALSPQAAAAVTDQLLEALAYAHSRGVVHRDIKPDNVFVTDEGRVKLADFGIARFSEQTRFTQEGTVMGTPGYMAPEQVRGLSADERADIFAAGAILYEMLSGENPFGARAGIESTAIMYRIVHEDPPPLPPEIGDPLRTVALIALNKDPEARFASADEMRAALAGVATQRHVVATQQTNVAARNLAPAWAYAVAVLAVVGIGLWVWSGTGSSASRSRTSTSASEAADATPAEEEVSGAATEEVRTMAEEANSEMERILEDWRALAQEWSAPQYGGMWPQASLSHDRNLTARMPEMRQLLRGVESLEQTADGDEALALSSVGAQVQALLSLAEGDGGYRERLLHLARARWHGWRAATLLGSDENRRQALDMLESAAAVTGPGLPLLFYVDELGPITVTAESYQYAVRWLDSDAVLTGHKMGVQEFLDLERGERDFYIADADGPYYHLGGSGGIQFIDRALPTDLDDDGYPLPGLDRVRVYTLEPMQYRTNEPFQSLALVEKP